MEDYLQTEWPELEGLPDLDHRAVGGDRRAGPAGARGDRAAGRGYRLSTMRRSRTWRCGPAPSPACRAGCSASPSPASSASRSTCRPTTARPSGRRSGKPAARFGITPYGTEAMHVLRAEKGYIIVGQETDGTVTPDDLGLAGLVGKAKPDFVGKRSLLAARYGGGRAASSSSGCAPSTRRSCWTRARRSSPIRRSRCRCRCSATSRRAT